MEENQSGIYGESVAAQARADALEFYADAARERLQDALFRTDAALSHLTPLSECIAAGEMSAAGVHYYAAGKRAALQELLHKASPRADDVQQQTMYGLEKEHTCPVCGKAVRVQRHWVQCPMRKAAVCMAHCREGCAYYFETGICYARCTYRTSRKEG